MPVEVVSVATQHSSKFTVPEEIKTTHLLMLLLVIKMYHTVQKR